MSIDDEQLTFSPSLSTSRSEEKAVLGSLNDRFVSYIGNVKALTDRNLWLMKRIKQLENAPSTSSKTSHESLKSAQARLQQLAIEQTKLELALQQQSKKLEDCQKRLNREKEDRKNAESRLASLRKDVDHATLARNSLESQAEILKEEIDLVRSNSEENFRVLAEKLIASRNTKVGETYIVESLADSLQHVRSTLDDIARKSKCPFEKHYLQKIDDLSSKLRIEKNVNEANKSEIQKTNKRVQVAGREMDKIYLKRDLLLQQTQTTKNRHQIEQMDHKKITDNLRRKLVHTEQTHLRQLERYSELLNVKVNLDFELKTYRKLLEDEEISLKNYPQLNSEKNLQNGDRSDDVEIEERDYQMKKHYYSLFPLEIGVDSAHQSKIHPKFSSNDHHETDSRPLKNGDVFVHSTEALPATPTENLSTDVFENDTDFHGVMLLKESVGRHHPLLDECRASCRSETWSVEAEEVDIAHDDAILDKEDVFQQET